MFPNNLTAFATTISVLPSWKIAATPMLIIPVRYVMISKAITPSEMNKFYTMTARGPCPSPTDQFSLVKGVSAFAERVRNNENGSPHQIQFFENALYKFSCVIIFPQNLN